MRFSEITATEATIAQQGLAHLDKIPLDIPVSGDASLRLTGTIFHRKDNQASYYFQKQVPKERIVLHFTAGHLRGDLITLTGTKHVSVPYVIARDGIIYQLFNPASWSYHLGPGAVGGNEIESSKTIGIEISNYGPLLRNRNQLETIYSEAGRHDVYCNLEDVDQYVHSQAFRGREYFASFTDLQYDALIILIRHLTHLFNIPRTFLSEDLRYQAGHHLVNHQGIVSHVNYRSSGKWDIGPAFDWGRVIEGVSASVFIPLSPLEHKINRKKREIANAERIVKEQKVIIKALKKEVANLEAELPEPAQRSVFIPQGVFSQLQANEIFSSDLEVKANIGEEDIDPGYYQHNDIFINGTNTD